MFGTAESDGASFDNYPHANNVTSEVEGVQVELRISENCAQAIVDSGLVPHHDTGNKPFDSFNISQRVATDNRFRCLDERTAYAGAVTGAFGEGLLLPVPAHDLGLPSERPRRRARAARLPAGRSVCAVLPAPTARIKGGRSGTSRSSATRRISGVCSLETDSYASVAKWGDPSTPLAYLTAKGYERAVKGQQSSGPSLPVHGVPGATDQVAGLAE